MPNPNCIHIGHSQMPRLRPKMPKEYASQRTLKTRKMTENKEVRWVTKAICNKGFRGNSSVLSC